MALASCFSVQMCEQYADLRSIRSMRMRHSKLGKRPRWSKLVNAF